MKSLSKPLVRESGVSRGRDGSRSGWMDTTGGYWLRSSSALLPAKDMITVEVTQALTGFMVSCI